jgi:hypothetical protein
MGQQFCFLQLNHYIFHSALNKGMPSTKSRLTFEMSLVFHVAFKPTQVSKTTENGE